MSFTIAIVGRPNVGKSTLFNRLAQKNLALVHDQPGVTRDRRYGQGKLGDLDFTMIDTAGLEQENTELQQQMHQQTSIAIADADLVLFIVDASVGLMPADEKWAGLIRRQGKSVLLVANKSDTKKSAQTLFDFYKLGMGDPIPISAVHAQGLGDLYDDIQKIYQNHLYQASHANEEEESTTVKPLQLAIVGRPNVGKSTLLNSLLGTERVITGPTPGVTRDPIRVAWDYKDQPIHLIDTAGLRRQSRVDDRVEELSFHETKRMIDLAEVVILVCDATMLLEHQDLHIASTIIQEGRAMVLVVNKWDKISAAQRKKWIQDLEDQIEKSIAQIKELPKIFLSAKNGENLTQLMPLVFKTYKRWNKRVATGPLNQWLEKALEIHNPPIVKSRRLKIRYITQIKARPPTFSIWGNVGEKDFPQDYKRYLLNSLAEAFDLTGVPLRMVFRKAQNPYVSQKRQKK